MTSLLVAVLGLVVASALGSDDCGHKITVPLANMAKFYNLTVDGSPWLNSAPFVVTMSGKTYTSADGSMTALNISMIQGSDPYGDYEGWKVLWSTSATEPTFATSCRVYSCMVIFEQEYLSEATGTAIQYGKPSSAFPSFTIEELSNEPRGFLAFQGRFIEGSHAGPWNQELGVGSGGSSGPFAIYNQDMSKVAMLSPASQFMASSLHVDTHNGWLGWGLLGSITTVPAGFAMETIVSFGPSGAGITGTAEAWGKQLRTRYGKDAAEARSKDYTLSNLGFSTDNGAFYYYNTERLPNGSHTNYEKTLLDVHAYSVQAGIPYKYALLDSWWYTKGMGGGVKNWREDVFPDGALYLSQKTGWKFQAHNRMWSADNVYAKQNGGAYDFIVESKLAIPNEQRLWDDLMMNASKWGMVVYEQDWMFNEFEGLNATLQSATLPREWLIQMGKGAAKANATLQYCMTYARMLLQTLEIPAASQFRASDDYHPGQTVGCRFPYCVYYIGTTSILAHALGLAPSKDNFWSTDIQTDSPYGNKTIEPYGEMQAAVLAYSTGPVAASDKVGKSNVTRILGTCTKDGTLLQPTRPATTIDACLLQAAFGTGGPVPNRDRVYPVMSTHTIVSGVKWAHVLSIELNQTFMLKPSHLPLDLTSSQQYVAWKGYGSSSNVTVLGKFTASTPIELRPNNAGCFNLIHAAPVHSNNYVFLGEPEKWVPIAVARVKTVEASSSDIRVVISGDGGEIVTLVFAHADSYELTLVKCTLPAHGSATVSLASKSCT